MDIWVCSVTFESMVKPFGFHICPGNTVMGHYLSQNCGEHPDSKWTTSGHRHAVLATDIGMKPQVATRLPDDFIAVVSAKQAGELSSVGIWRWVPSDVVTDWAMPMSRPTMASVAARSKAGWEAVKLTCQRPARSMVNLAEPVAAMSLH